MNNSILKLREKYGGTFDLIVIIAAVIICYSFMLQSPFKSMDDQFSIVNNEDIKSFDNIGKIFRSSFFGEGHYYRPLVALSFMLEYHLFGLNSFYYHLISLMLHALSAVVVYGLIFVLVNNRTRAFFISFLFAIHPINSEAVWNIADRSILLSSLFVLSSFLSYCHAQKKTQRVFFYIMSWLFFTLGLLAKESAVMLPVVLCAYELLSNNNEGRRRHGLKPVLPFFLIIIFVVILRRCLGIVEVFAWGSVSAYIFGFLTFLRGLLTYVRLFIFPVDLYFDRSRAMFISFQDPQLIFTLFAVILSLAVFFKNRNRISKTALFFMVWFLVELFPVSQIVTSIGVSPGYISTSEHFLYTASVGMFGLLVLTYQRIISYMRDKNQFSSQLSSIIAVIFIIFLMATTIQQNIYASHPVAMLKRSVEMNPNNERVLYSLAMELIRQKRFDEAQQHLKQILNINPVNARAQIAYGKLLCDKGKCWESVLVYEKVRNPQKLKDVLYENLNATYRLLINQYEQQLKSDKKNNDLHFRLGYIYQKLGNEKKAKYHFKKIRLDQ